MSTDDGGWGFEDLGFARVDHDRVRRRGYPEAIFAPGKTSEQVLSIGERLVAAGATNVLVTRASDSLLRMLEDRFEAARLVPEAGLCILNPEDGRRIGRVAVIAWRPEDGPVAQEAAYTAEAFGSAVDRRFDAPLHRPEFFAEWLAATPPARVIVAVDGAGGALPSVVGGLARSIVIAVPTSTGRAWGGVPALLAALNSCVPGVLAVNIDNGFGGGYAAHVVNAGFEVTEGRELELVGSRARREEER